jgi:hypothetical protein
VLCIPSGHRITCMERRLRLITGGFHAPLPSLIVLVLDGEQGNGGVDAVHEVLLTKHHECLACDHLQSVAHVVSSGRRGSSHPARLLGVERNVNADLTTPKLELTENMTVVVGLLHVAEALQHVPQQTGNPWWCSPSVVNEPSGPTRQYE